MTIKDILLLPFYLVGFVVFMLLWFITTLTGIGPLLQFYYSEKDKKLLSRTRLLSLYPDLKLVNIPGDVNKASKGQDYFVMARYSIPKDSENIKGYICIPNGLGATLCIIARVQDMLVERGYCVVSFDRFGVGFSDDNLTSMSPDAVDVSLECDYIMNDFARTLSNVVDVPSEQIKWTLLGPSMGSIVSQCYIALFPHKVCGFLNMDGLPYPFHKSSSQFMWAALIYKIYAAIIWTGLMRPMISVMIKSSSRMISSKTFPIEIAIAQLNQARFFGNIGIEMKTMMDCCRFASHAWGSIDILKLPEELAIQLMKVEPSESVDIDSNTYDRFLTTFRSKSEVGSEWISTDEVRILKSMLMEITSELDYSEVSNSTFKSMLIQKNMKSYSSDLTIHSLKKVWSNIVVQVMSARNHNFGNALADSFYSQEVSRWFTRFNLSNTIIFNR